MSTSRQSPLRNRDFRLLAGSIGVSALGDWLAAVPLILLVVADAAPTGGCAGRRRARPSP